MSPGFGVNQVLQMSLSFNDCQNNLPSNKTSLCFSPTPLVSGPKVPTHENKSNEPALATLVSELQRIEVQLARIADHFDPPPPDKVGTPYIAERLGCTTDYVAVMVREETIPLSCLVPGTGNGKPWKFFRKRIDNWIEQR